MLPRVKDPEAFRRDLRELSYWLKIGLSKRKRFDPKAAHAALDDLHGKLAAAHSALRGLSSDASMRLAARASLQPVRARGDGGESLWQRLDPPEAGPRGSARVQWIDRAIADCSRWAAEARANVELLRVIKPDPDEPNTHARRRGGGRPGDPNAEEAMRNLAWLWEEQTGERAAITTDPILGSKSGLFLEFSQTVIEPIYSALGIKPPSIGPLAQRVLYPPKKRGTD